MLSEEHEFPFNVGSLNGQETIFSGVQKNNGGDQAEKNGSNNRNSRDFLFLIELIRINQGDPVTIIADLLNYVGTTAVRHHLPDECQFPFRIIIIRQYKIAA